MELATERLVLRPWAMDDLDALLAIRNAAEVIRTTHTGEPLPRERMAGQLGARDLFERVGFARVYAGVDPTDEKSLRVVAKARGFRKIDDELYELTAEAFGAPNALGSPHE